jgi:hypothetical protein
MKKGAYGCRVAIRNVKRNRIGQLRLYKAQASIQHMLPRWLVYGSNKEKKRTTTRDGGRSDAEVRYSAPPFLSTATSIIPVALAR